MHVYTWCCAVHRAFQNARGLAADGGGIDGRGVSTLVPLLRRAVAASAAGGDGQHEAPAQNGAADTAPASNGAAGGASLQGCAASDDVAVPLCSALRALAVNDDVCRVRI